MRNSGNQREELARAEAQWLTVPDWEIPKQKISWEKNLYSFMAKPKSGPPSKPEGISRPGGLADGRLFQKNETFLIFTARPAAYRRQIFCIA